MSEQKVSNNSVGAGSTEHLQRPVVTGRENAKDAKVSPANRTIGAIAPDQREANNKARPDCGADESRHSSKNIGNKSVPNCGGVSHPEKSK
jgi:hypothetical protein